MQLICYVIRQQTTVRVVYSPRCLQSTVSCAQLFLFLKERVEVFRSVAH